MPEAVGVSIRESSQRYQLRVVQEVLLALLAKERSHGYQLRARLQLALGPLADALNAGQVYVTLSRLEKAGLVASERVGQADRPDRKVYELTEAGRTRVLEWLAAAQRAALAEPDRSVAGLLLEGVVLRLQADLRWLEACARYWNDTKGR